MQLAPEETRHRQVLEEVLGPASEITPLPRGSTGRSYRVAVEGGDFAAKFFDDKAAVLLGPAQQFELLRTVSGRGIAPEPAACYPEHGLLITFFLRSTTGIDTQSLTEPAVLAGVVRLLRELHEETLPVPDFDPGAYAQQYAQAAGGEGVFGNSDRALFDELIALVDDEPVDAVCLCHNDLLADNIRMGRRPVLIDFDFAVTASPILDLASLVVMNSLDQPAARRLLNLYYGADWPFTEARFARVQRLQRLLAHFWVLASVDYSAAIVSRYRLSND